MSNEIKKAKPIRFICCNHFTHGGFLTTGCHIHPEENLHPVYKVINTDYGVLRNTAGDMRIFKTYSGAYKAAQKYNQVRGIF